MLHRTTLWFSFLIYWNLVSIADAARRYGRGRYGQSDEYGSICDGIPVEDMGNDVYQMCFDDGNVDPISWTDLAGTIVFTVAFSASVVGVILLPFIAAIHTIRAWRDKDNVDTHLKFAKRCVMFWIASGLFLYFKFG